MLIVLLNLFIVKDTWAKKFHMRRCSVLPITDSVDGAVGIAVYKKLEETLKYDSWCQYHSISGMFDILVRHRHNLKQYLDNKDVIRAISNKMQVGSLIKIHLEGSVDTIRVDVEILGQNGEDTYLKESTILDKIDTDLIVQTIKNWIDLYEQQLPYDGLVTGVLGDQITIDMGKKEKISIGQNFQVSRMTDKKQHPLLKKIVAWQSEPIASGKIFNISQESVLGQIRSYQGSKKISKNDWVILDAAIGPSENVVERFAKEEEKRFGKLGKVKLGLNVAKNSIATSVSGSSKSVDGLNLGFDVAAEAWITRNWIVLGELSRSFGSLSRKDGNLEQSSVSTVNGAFKLMGGYRLLPMGFFYGPQIDVYGGYGSYRYGPDTVAADGFSEGVFSGMIVGTKIDIPIISEVRGFARIELMPFIADYKDEDGVYGDARSTSNMLFEVGGSYQYDEGMTIDGAIQNTSNKAKFHTSPESLHYRDTAIKVSVTYTY